MSIQLSRELAAVRAERDFADRMLAYAEEKLAALHAPAPADLPVVIVTRHAGAVEWLRRHGVEGEVVAQADAATVAGRVVVGALPLHLAALAAEVVAIDMNLPPNLRGVDLTPEQMDECGATLRRYRVLALESETP